MVSSLVLNSSVFVNLSVKDHSSIIIASQYSSPSADLGIDFDEWLDSYPDYENLIMGADLNVRMKVLGYAREDHRTEIFMHTLVSNNLFLINDPDASHSWQVDDRKGHPDVTIGGIGVCNKISAWTVDNINHSFSDHKYINFNLDLAPQIKYNTRYKTKNKKFKKFNDIIGNDLVNLQGILSGVDTVEKLDDWLQDYYLCLASTMDRCFRRGVLSHKPKIHWYTSDLRISRNRINAKYKRMVKNPDNERYKNSYLEERRLYKKHMRKAKADSWLDFCQTTTQSYGGLYKYVAGKKMKHTDMVFTVAEESEVFDTYDMVLRDLIG